MKQKLPRKMLVWDTHRASATERIVFAILPENVMCGRYLTVYPINEEHFEQGEKFRWAAYDNAEEIEETKKLPLDCKDCEFEYYNDNQEPCTSCEYGSNYKQFETAAETTTGTLRGMSGVWMPENGLNDRLEAIEKEIKKLKKKIKCQNNP